MPQQMIKSGTTEISYRDAVREAIRDALRRDDRVFLMGEDVGRYGGCYGVSKGPPGRIRRGTDPRYAPVGIRVYRCRHRCGDGRHAPDR